MVVCGGSAFSQRMYDSSGRQIGRVDSERYYDSSGRQIGRVDGLTIYDASGRQLGRIDGNHVYNSSGSQIGRIDGDRLYSASGTQMGRIDGRARLHQAMYIWNKSSLQDYILSAVGERQEMANSVEGRLPFLDHHLIEVAGAVPPNLLIKDNVEKFILRQAVKGLLPPSFAQRRKKPFFSPPASLVRNSPLNQMIFDTLSGPLPSFVDRAKVHAFLKSAPILGEEKFRTYHDAKDTQVMAADLALTYLSSLCVLGKQFGM